MTQSIPDTNLPNDVYLRATELSNEGMPFSKAVGKAVNEMRHGDVDWTLQDIADAMDVTTNTINTYMSKAKNDIDSSLALFVMTFGGSRTILASTTDSYEYSKQYFLVSEFGNGSKDEYMPARNGEAGIALIEAQGGAMNGPTIHLDVTTQCVYDSIEEFVIEEYVDKEFGSMEKAGIVYNLLIEAGVDEESIPKPGESLPPSHPDSPEHFQYQMRSLEPPESRRPERF